MPKRHVPLAEISRPHGVRGELRLKVFNEDSDLLLGRPPVRLRLPDGTEREARMTEARMSNKALLVRLEGIADRDAADTLRGALVCVARDAFPPLEGGEFYTCDIEGAQAVLASGEEVGRIATIRSYPTCDVLVVERKVGGELEVPLIEQYVVSVDAANARVELAHLEELAEKI